ncbi:MAG TPA: glutamate synthase central domain-containing protein, partial [Geobacterales bacterium]|nr:glutamate synthase central domain-containing protein [Geobacterales bacterium]
MDHRHQDFSSLIPPERDACAIISYVNKENRPTHGNLQRTIDALIKMGHRAGEINGEGDGCGILTDIPRLLWREILATAGANPHLVDDGRFAIGHIMIPAAARNRRDELKQEILARFERAGCQLVTERPALVRSEVLASNARDDEPFLWQVALLAPATDGDANLYRLQLALESDLPLHVPSLSRFVTAYKVHGAPELLTRYYPELRRRDFLSAITIGHSRYSTNTMPTVLRAQPFSLIGHNGEINTIGRLREEALLMGIPLPPDGSDSQDLNRIIEGLLFQHGLTLPEAMEMIFPPIFSAMEQMPPDLRQLYTWFRRFLKASAQGPAAVIARHGDCCVFSVDAMGLRPLWFGETDKEWFASSELGVVPHEEILTDPKPLAPGEKVAIIMGRHQAKLLEHGELRREVQRRFRRRASLAATGAIPAAADSLLHSSEKKKHLFDRAARLPQDNLMSALAWKTSDLANLKEMARSGRDPIASLGYDGPLAALALQRQNLSDYFKEQVAVVTNPAIDRERENEHFSTTIFVGPRPTIGGRPTPSVKLATPLLLGGTRNIPATPHLALANLHGTTTLEALLEHFGPRRYRILSCHLGRDERVEQAVARLTSEAVTAVTAGVQLLLIDDNLLFTPGRDFLDPFLATARIHSVLRDTVVHGSPLRRRVSLVVRSGALRNLHDLIFLLGMGADALSPHLMWELAESEEHGVANLLRTLTVGLEKVISTMGIHEIGGYGKYFAAIGLAPELADFFETPNFCGSDLGGLTFSRLEENQRQRRQVALSKDKQPVPLQFRLYPKIWKMVGAVAKMEESYADLSRLIQQLETENPLAIRHLLDLRYTDELTVDPEEVDTTVGGHDLPILISAMSFGSQGETPFRIYAETARRLNIICMNGEGGEIADMLGLYRKNRGQQVASGRFGV